MITFTIPGLRLRSLNSREHWRVKAKRVKAERLRTKWAMVGSADHLYAIAKTITITRIGPRLLDSDNAVGSAKHVRDEVAACLGVDDGDPFITWNIEQEKGKYGVRVRIETEADQYKAVYHSDFHIRTSMIDGPSFASVTQDRVPATLSRKSLGESPGPGLHLHVGPPKGTRIR